MKPKKLIRKNITSLLKDDEFEQITDLIELNRLYALKIKEELAEIQQAKHNDIMEFVDLFDVVIAFAKVNGFPLADVIVKSFVKKDSKGGFDNIALNNLNPTNPSNKLYFEDINQQ